MHSLSGVVVADFSRVLSGPTATMFLADLGADVIKIERPGVGDDTRAWGPPFLGEDSTYFLSTNRNKRSAELDLTDAEGIEAARELVRRADVLVENFRPGTMDRLGLGYQDARRLNPRLVYCSISGFGSGAGASRPGYDFVVQAMGGLMSVTGEPDGDPMKVGVALVDMLAGLHATIGILASLRERDQTGKGRHVEVNLLSSLISSLANQGSAFAAAGVVPQRLGNAHPSIAPYELFETADGQVAVACGTDRQFVQLCRAVDQSAIAEDPRFITNRDRVEHRTELREMLTAAFSRFSTAQLLSCLEETGVPVGPVNDLAEAFNLATALGLEPIQYVKGANGPVAQLSSPLRFDGEVPAVQELPPRLGEHTEEVLRWLGQSQAVEANR
ncbi:CaiB/BaiF CoA-transferase family protein [Nocardioides sp. AE5]|uniref:CaiB/BaiF CoA transferase family protein n=1 Tax=Nocardioides sp. AE5 TaxID=2962573 RepID=UPI002880ED72|nr:CaiB/BaiF CoA-transferase family protein [Nocardioides sp. AE5]MDT0202487.1 CaiB/BaiF CoA-transferase family protein [Nocardioides sp. AE5]